MSDLSTHFVTGLDEGERDYIKVFHAHDETEEGFPVVEVESYFDDGDMYLGEDSDQALEQVIYNAMDMAREIGVALVIFN